MALRVYDLNKNISTEESQQGSSSITAAKIPDNITYTWITVKTVNVNFNLSLTNPIATTVTDKTITSQPLSVQSNNINSSNAFSATQRLASSISLPLPKNIPFQWQNDWSQQETNAIEQGISKAAAGGVQTFTDIKEAAIAGIENIIIGALNKTALQKTMQKNIGFAENPFKEVYYNGVSFRTFQFDWEFAPSNSQESRNIQQLIYELEYASHPEVIGVLGSGQAYKIPDSFEIKFVGTKIPKLQTLVLTNLNVNYTPNGPKFFKDGQPAFIEMGLNFIELLPLTKKEIQESHLENGGTI